MKNLPKINPAKAVKASLPYLIAGLLCTKLGEAYRLTTGGDVIDRLLAAFTKLGLVFQNPFPSLHPFDLLVGAAAAVLLRLVVWSKIKNAKKYRHGEEYGTARWGNEKDIAPFINSDFSQNILLTDTERLTLGKIADPEKRNVNLNVLVIGGSGSGKTRYHIKPNLLQMNTFDAYNWSILENKQKFIGQLMSGKNPSRSCEDVDEAALSYAEVKALASGDPRIIEMTDLDSQVTKLKLLKANHEGQRYMLEDRLIQFFPKAINGTKEQIQGLEGDLAVFQAHPQPDKEHFSITVAGQTYTERKAAGQAIIDACTKMTDVSQRVELGEYRGFPMTLWADTATQKFQVTMKQNLSHTIELGSDPVGNIARLDNALAAIAENLEQNKGKLENLTAQMEEAKLEVKRPFPQEQELVEKTSRLNVLRIALNMDGKSTGKRERDKAELDGGKPSIKGMLKRLGVESAATASPPQKDKDMEVAI